METEKDLLMYLQTTLRNMGLYTSLSYGALGYSRYYIDAKNIYNIYLIIVALVFNFITIYIGICLIIDINKFDNKLKSKSIKKWKVLPITIMIFNSGTLLLLLITLLTTLYTKYIKIG
jgi:hypothetical protein